MKAPMQAGSGPRVLPAGARQHTPHSLPAAALLLGGFLWLAAQSGIGATYTVISAADSGIGSLRTAIDNANANLGTDTIAFDLPASLVISLATPLPVVSEKVRINGASQPGYTKTPLVTLARVSSSVTNGLVLGASGCTVTAIRVHGFDSGILATASVCAIQSCYFMSNTVAGVFVRAGGTRILDNYFATNDTGIYLEFGNTNSVLGNSIGVHPLTGSVNGNRRGINVVSGRNYIGGTAAGEGNVISGNAQCGIEISWISSSNSVRGNLIGTDATGTTAVPNDVGIRIDGTDHTIGGIKTGSRNVISGNRTYGIEMSSSTQPIVRNKIEGNFIGTDVTGSNALPNDVGIFLEETACKSNAIGGSLESQRNVVSGNAGEGIYVNYAPYNAIRGNYVGLDVSGRYDLGNGSHGVLIENAWNSEVGGTNSGAGNVVSGNGGHGVFLFGVLSDGSTVRQNRIGTTAAGGQAVANDNSGVMVSGARETTIGGIGAGNVISGNGEYGVYVTGANAHGVAVQGNWIGTTASGQSALGNGYEGIYLTDAPSNLIGGVAASAGNVVSANGGQGIVVTGAGSVSNVVQSNLIGVDEDGEDPLPNRFSGLYLTGTRGCRIGGDLFVGGGNLISGNGSDGIRMINCSACELLGNRIGGHVAGAGFGGNTNAGIYLQGSSSNNLIGGDVWSEANVVAYNGNAGIALGGTSNSVGNRIDYNWIFENGELGIDLGDDGPTPNDVFIGGDPDDGPNNLQNFPSITNVFVDGSDLRIQGLIRSGIGQTYKINFYGSTQIDPSGYGEGEFILGTTNVTTSPLDQARFDATVPAPDPLPDYYAATATHLASGDTSEFSHFAMLDSDGDGMPDGWEQRHFGGATAGDPAGHGDDDGIPNLDEFNADTDPTDGDSFLHIVAFSVTDFLAGRHAAVLFPSSAFRQYRVEHAAESDLATNGWSAGVAGYEPGTGEDMTGLDVLPAGTTSAHFRVRGRLP